jgi:8-oxo-dGTP pyrophosphatase MutT (NUDIX family)
MLLVIQKTDSAGYHWRDQVALPGGRFEPSDGSASNAALRELQEELGIDPLSVEVLGELGHFQTATSKNDLTVVVGRWMHPSEVRADAREVARVLEIPLPDLVDLHLSRRLSCYDQPCGANSPVYPVQGVQIWGVTARILHYFLDMVLSEDGVISRK